ncbi:hypothetical protein KSP39_PZI014385 [Platanthera zijinensis]|uniref:Uncharacterized protein n=1 Tax=Platanthera zijinensis TaxID=2320716 RepID=A0AAP0G263_9ASPA
MRALELHHMVVLRGFNLSHLLQKAEQKHDLAQDKVGDLERRLDIAKDLLTKGAGGLPPSSVGGVTGLDVSHIQTWDNNTASSTLEFIL